MLRPSDTCFVSKYSLYFDARFNFFFNFMLDQADMTYRPSSDESEDTVMDITEDIDGPVTPKKIHSISRQPHDIDEQVIMSLHKPTQPY